MYDSYIIVAILIGWFVVFWIASSKNENLFNKKLKKQMIAEDEQYFEIRYFKNIPFLYLLLSIVVAFAVFSVVNEFYIFKLCLSIIILGAGIANYIYRAVMYKIVFDHGQITLYIGNKVKETGTFDEAKGISRPYIAKNGPNFPYQIIFEWGGMIKSAKLIEFNEDMDNSYQLVALLEKGGYFDKKKFKKE
ncbi:MAG: hypothetical protein CSB47_05020 [Proteobacteria bacterium]|nr:MAG: hypothetical protein CSB47_05020 [Pseudomonadota bacterium]